MYRYLKQQETLQASIAVQNLNSLGFSSPTQPYQPSELNLPENLQKLPPNLQDIQPCQKVVMRSSLVQTEAGTGYYAPISSSWVTVYGVPRLVK